MTAQLRDPCTPTTDVCSATLPRVHVAAGEGVHRCHRADRHQRRLSDRHECVCGVAWPVDELAPAPSLREILGLDR
jgi:hypothetical protein